MLKWFLWKMFTENCILSKLECQWMLCSLELLCCINVCASYVNVLTDNCVVISTLRACVSRHEEWCVLACAVYTQIPDPVHLAGWYHQCRGGWSEHGRVRARPHPPARPPPQEEEEDGWVSVGSCVCAEWALPNLVFSEMRRFGVAPQRNWSSLGFAPSSPTLGFCRCIALSFFYPFPLEPSCSLRELSACFYSEAQDYQKWQGLW